MAIPRVSDPGYTCEICGKNYLVALGHFELGCGAHSQIERDDFLERKNSERFSVTDYFDRGLNLDIDNLQEDDLF